MHNYISGLRKSVISNDRLVNGVPINKKLIKDEPIAIVFLVIDSIYDSNKLYLNNNLYNGLIQDCKKYLELSRIIE